MRHTIEVEIPDGFDLVGFRLPVWNEQFLRNGDVVDCLVSNHPSDKVIIVKPVRWMPAHNEKYFYLSAVLGANQTINSSSVTDNKLFSAGNFFKTEEDCQSAAEKVSALLLKLKDSS